MARSGKLVIAASLVVSMHVSADSRPPEPFSAETASDMSDADVLAERHLALYRVSRAATFGWRDSSPEDSTPVSVHTSATAPLPLPREQPRSDTEIISAQ